MSSITEKKLLKFKSEFDAMKEENQKLKDEYEEMYDARCDAEEQYRELEKENEKLKGNYDCLSENISKTIEEVKRLSELEEIICTDLFEAAGVMEKTQPHKLQYMIQKLKDNNKEEEYITELEDKLEMYSDENASQVKEIKKLKNHISTLKHRNKKLSENIRNDKKHFEFIRNQLSVNGSRNLAELVHHRMKEIE